MATLDQVVSQMMAADMPPLPAGHPIPDGKFHRFGKKSKAWYKLHEFVGRTGRRYISGTFGIWRGNDAGAIKVDTDYEGMDAVEAERLKRSQAELEQREEAKRAERARFAANRARDQYHNGRATGESPYLQRKGVEPDKGLRFAADGTLLVPMVRYDVTEEQEKSAEEDAPRRLVGLQKIAPDGVKLFNKGMMKVGSACRLGRSPKDGDLLIIVEGVATGLSIRQATGRSRPVYVAFDAGNLAAVAAILRKLYPHSPFLFCADDDAYLEAQLSKRLRNEFDVPDALYRVTEAITEFAGKGGAIKVGAEWHGDDDGVQLMTGAVFAPNPSGPLDKPHTFVIKNAGRTCANEAARAVQPARVCWPVFKAREIHANPELPKFTDFNDLHAADGLAAVERQIADAIEMALAGHKGEPSPVSKAGAKDKRKGRGGDRGGGHGPDEPQWERFWHLVNRFTYIYPTDTAYDHQLGDIVQITAMRYKFGADWVGMWLASAKRREVDLPNVVFDPAGKSKGPHLNLFRGLPLTPSTEGSCEKQLGLLQYLCGEADQEQTPVTEWVLKWLAYPLQHLGAKMQTALIFAGKEGTGKNLFFGSVREIYGQHSGYITQRELEDKFNIWLSAKLFIIANEVVTRQEMGHISGYLRHLITESRITINRKQRDAREEDNHVNAVFFSNELQPIKLNIDDRRYMMVRTPPPRDEAYYRAVSAEIAAGGSAALYKYLLDLELGDFHEHTKPLATEAKRELIEIGMKSPQLFWEELHAGLLDLPYGPALFDDLFRCYLSWCRRHSVKMPLQSNFFSPEFMSMNGVRRVQPRVFVPECTSAGWSRSDIRKQRRVYLMGEPFASELTDALERQKAEQQWLDDAVMKFAKAAQLYCGVSREA